MKLHMNKRWRAVLLLLAALCLGGIEIALIRSEIGQRAETFSTDVWFGLRGPTAPPEDVVIVALDEASYPALGVRPDQVWPRALHARMLDVLQQLGARRVVMDIVFAEPGSDEATDLALAEAMQALPTVIGADTGSRYQWIGQEQYLIEELVEPAELFGTAAEQVALVKMPQDYGWSRRFFLPRSELTAGIPSLYEAAVYGSTVPPLRPGERDMLWYYGPPGTIRTYSYHVLLDSEIPPGAVKDKIVFIGLNLRTGLGPEQKDAFRIPYQGLEMFGVEIHATAAANLLGRQWLRRASNEIEQWSLFAAAVVLGMLIFSLRPQWSALLVVGAAGLWAFSAYAAFLHLAFVPGVTLFLVTVPVAFMTSTLIYYVTTLREQRKVERAFALYLPPQMARQMRQNPRALLLGGENVVATALFTDIAGFTPIAESMPSIAVAHMLNDYFTQIVRVVFACQGTLIKFIGDAVFAIYGAPIAMKNHAELACRTALGIQEALNKFNAQGKYPKLISRIGISTGDMVVGNLGSAERFDYTAIGDTVNLASRLEGVNKYVGTTVLISETVAQEVKDVLQPIKLAKVQVVGKSEPISIYTLNDGSVSDATLQIWNQALTDFWGANRKTSALGFVQVHRGALLLSGMAGLYLREVQGGSTRDLSFNEAGELVLEKK